MRNAKIHLLTANLRVGLALGLAALMAWTFLSAYPWQWAGRWVVRGVYGAQGDLAWWRGDQTRALAFYTQAARAQPESVDALIDLAQAQAGAGDAAAATATYQAAWRLRPTYIPASAGLGDLLRRQGELDAAREAFAGAYVDAQQVADWSWRNLAPPPAALIAVGDGLDFGYVGGVYPAEMQQGEQVRWTNGAGLLRLAAGEHPRLLRLRLASGRPEPVVALVCARDTCQPLLVEPAWRTYRVLLPPAPGAEQTIALRSESFVGPQDGRRLGILVDWASVR